MISDGGFANEGSSSLSTKKALRYVKILCFLPFFFFLIVLAKILIFAEGVLLRVIKSQRVESAKGEPRP